MAENNDEKFIEMCRKHQAELIALFQADVFETKGTKIIINFDGNGVMQEVVQGERQLWRRKKNLTIRQNGGRLGIEFS